jgi:hypothetical protein
MAHLHAYNRFGVNEWLTYTRVAMVTGFPRLRRSLVCELCHISCVNWYRISICTVQLDLQHGLRWITMETDESRHKLARECDVDPVLWCGNGVKVKGTLHRPFRPKGEYNCSSTLSLASVLEGDGVASSMPRPLYPGERPSTYCTWGWVGHRVGLDGCGKSRRHRDSITRPSSL